MKFDDTNKSLETIFEELYKLYDINIKSNDNITIMLSEDNILSQDYNDAKVIIQSELNPDKNITNNGKKITPKDEENERLKQLLINQKLQGEIHRSLQIADNNQQLMQIAQNPHQYAMQNPISSGLIPREYRQGIAPNIDLTRPQPPQSNSPVKMVVGAASAFGTRLFQTGSAIMVSQLIFKFLSPILYGVNLIGSAFNIGNTPTTMSFTPDKLQKIVFNPNTEKFEMDDPNSAHNVVDKTSSFANLIQNMKNNPKLREVVNKLNPNLISPTGEVLRANDGSVTPIVYPAGSDVPPSMFSFENIAGATTFSMIYAIRYIAIAIGIAAVIILIYKYVKSKIEKSKKEEYSQVNDVMVNEITIPMLCEYFEKDALYFKQVEIIDEGLIDWVKSILPTPTNFLKLINRGISAMVGASESINIALRDKIISPWIGKFGNFMLGIANTVLLAAKGALLGIINGPKDIKIA